jgi:hypothetical protein
MNKYNFKQAIIMLVTLAIVAIMIFEDGIAQQTAYNVLVFFTWFFSISYFLTFIVPDTFEAKKKFLNKFNIPESPHLPERVDEIFYFTMLFALAANGNFWMAAGWAAISCFDFAMRFQAKELLKKSNAKDPACETNQTLN